MIMGVNSSKKAIEKSIAVYEKMLEDLPEDVFIKTPAEGVWSYAEVYSHIFSSNIGCCKAISVCAAGTGIEDNKPLKFPLRLVMYFKRLPPGKYKVPEKIAKDVIKLSKEDASGLISKFRNTLAEITPLIEKASPTQKIKHPRFGLINAKQWYSFIHIHTLHHQRQLFRIQALHKQTSLNT